MRTERRALAGLLMALLLGAAGSCGLANGAGLVGHALYEDEVAECRFCATRGDACGESESGSWGCVSFAQLSGCAAAKDLFFEHEGEGSPYLMPARGRTSLDEGFRSDCESGTPYVADVLVYDFEFDALTSDFDPGEDDPERAGEVVLTDVDRNVHNPTSWSVQPYASNDGSDRAYVVEVVFCMSLVLEDPVALQITDKQGNHSNAICLDPP